MSNANYKYALTNIAILLYFLIFNPFLAVTLTAITNIVYKRINKVVFSFSFCLSWTLFYFIRDFAKHAGDIVGYLEWYYNSQFKSFQEIIYTFFQAPIQNELLWHLYNKVFYFFFEYNPFIYVLIIYASAYWLNGTTLKLFFSRLFEIEDVSEKLSLHPSVDKATLDIFFSFNLRFSVKIDKIKSYLKKKHKYRELKEDYEELEIHYNKFLMDIY